MLRSVEIVGARPFTPLVPAVPEPVVQTLPWDEINDHRFFLLLAECAEALKVAIRTRISRMLSKKIQNTNGKMGTLIQQLSNVSLDVFMHIFPLAQAIRGWRVINIYDAKTFANLLKVKAKLSDHNILWGVCLA